MANVTADLFTDELSTFSLLQEGQEFTAYSNTTDPNSNNTTTARSLTPLEALNLFFDVVHTMPLFTASTVLGVGYFYVLPAVALVCNSLTVATMTRLKPFTTSSLYICNLAVTDTLVLLLRMCTDLIDTFDLAVGNYGCGMLAFVLNMVLHVSVWTIVVMTLERFVAVIYPLRVSSLFTMKRTKLSIAMLFLIFTLLNAHFIYTTGLIYHDSKYIGYYCSHREGTDYWSLNIWFWINTAVFAALPCATILVLNIIIILGMRASLKKHKKMVLDENAKSDTQQRQVTVMLLCMSFSYIIFFVPVSVFMITAIGVNLIQSPQFYAEFYLRYRLTFFFSSLNHAINFFFYFASNKRFRVALVQVLKCQEVSGKKQFKVKDTMDTVSSAVSRTSQPASINDLATPSQTLSPTGTTAPSQPSVTPDVTRF